MIRTCLACRPERPPTWAELQGLCQTSSQNSCDFFRFARATGRPLLVEDYVAWQQRRRGRGPQFPSTTA
jgi:hypothetical protein